MTHLHDYKVINDTTEAQVEVCVECKKKLVTRKDKNGMIDNKAYMEEHKRDVLQPYDKEYKKYYGQDNN